MYNALRHRWHRFWLDYHMLLVKDCLDEQMKMQLIRKVEYHDNKLRAA
jgi:hypothetical protein